MSVVTTVQKEIESLKNSIKREKAIESNIFDKIGRASCRERV